MLPLERHRLIVELLGQHGVMRVNEIAQATRVSRETIRRDLSELERKGILTRSHGGALAAENPLPATRAAASALPVEDSQGNFQHRTLLHSEGKMRVARKALQFLKPGQTIVLDGSSTSWFMARQMPEMALTVITPSIRILQTLMSRRSLHLVGLGAISPRPKSRSSGKPPHERYANMPLIRSFPARGWSAIAACMRVRKPTPPC